MDVVRLGQALQPPPPPGLQWGIVQSNNDDGTANVRLGGSQTTLILPYATPAPAPPGRKVGVTAYGPDAAITHLMAPAAPPVCKARRTSGVQSINSATNTAIIYDSTMVDPWGMWNGSDTITAPVSGIYNVSAGWSFTGNGTGTRSGFIVVNGQAQVYVRENLGGDTNSVYQTLTSPLALSAGDAVTFMVNQTSGAALNALGTVVYDNWLTVAWSSWQGQTNLYGPELVVNGGAETLTTNNFSQAWNSNLVLSVTTTGGEYASGAAGFKGAGTGTCRWVHQGETLSVQPGDVYKISGKFRSSLTTSGTTSSGGYIELLYSGVTDGPNYFDAFSTPIATVVSPTVTNTTFKTLEGEYTVPDGVYWIRPTWRFEHTATINFFLDDLSIVKKDLS
jgi:hypothetical protein